MVAGDTNSVLRHDAAALVLVRRSCGRTEWAFGDRAGNAPPLASMSGRLAAMEAAGRLAHADPETHWWFIRDDALDAIAAELASDGFCILDGVLGARGQRALRHEVVALRSAGQLRPSRLAGGRTGSNTAFTHSAVRGDHMGWFTGNEPSLWPGGTLTAYLTRVDTLIAQLGSRVPDLARVGSRSKAMVACYPSGGARYVRHCDNSCSASEGERCNGRRLTAILYLNEEWSALDGGCLRLYAPSDPEAASRTLKRLTEQLQSCSSIAEKARLMPSIEAQLAAVDAQVDDGPPLCDVAPLGDRLVLFYADYRVPHEVLPAHHERLAITLWYFDADEHARAHAKGVAADQMDAREAEALERAIATIEGRYGSTVKRE